MIGTLLFATALLQQPAAPAQVAAQTATAPVLLAQAPAPDTSAGTVSLRVGDYDLDQFKSELKRALDLIDAGDETMGLEILDKLADQSRNVRRVRNLADQERPEHGKLFTERAKGNLTRSSDKVQDSLRELLRVDPFGTRNLVARVKVVYDALVSSETGILDLTSSVKGASFLVNGALAGLATDVPKRVSVLAGNVEVRVKMAGFPRDGVKTVTVEAAKVLAVDIAPRQVVPPLVLLSDRDDIDITMTSGGSAPTKLTFSKIAGLQTQLPAAATTELQRRITANGLDLVAGVVVPDSAIEIGRNISLTFTGRCLVELTRTISVTQELLAANESSPLLWLNADSIVKPEPDTGTLRVNSTPTGAEVFIDDQSFGSTPFARTFCSGPRTVRVRHRAVGSATRPTAVLKGRTETVDITLKPGIAFLGAIDATQSPQRSVPELATQVVQTLTDRVTSFNAALRLQLPPDVQRWTDQSAIGLVAAIDRNDTAQISQLLKVATDNFEAPLMVLAVHRGTSDVEFLFLWNTHTGVDRVRWRGQTGELAAIFTGLNEPTETDLVYQNDIGIRVADVALPGAPLLVTRVDGGGGVGVSVGENVDAVDGAVLTAQQLAERVRQKKPGDTMTLRISSLASAQPRTVTLTVRRMPRRAPVFDSSLQGNVLIAKLTAAALGAATTTDKDLYNFSLAAAYMRFGNYNEARTLLETLGNVTPGAGVGKGPALFMKARALEALGQKDLATAAYNDAKAADVKNQVFADDGTVVGTIADRHVAAGVGKTP